jgi:outer membrane protein assembly factor BamB
MKSPRSRADKRQITSFRIVSGMFAIAPLLLLLAAGNTSEYAQTSDNLSSTASSSAADWVEFHRDNMMRWNPYETKIGVGNASRLHLKWSVTVPHKFSFFGLTSSPAVVKGVLYVGSQDHSVYALNASTGAKLWSHATGDIVASSPAVANGVIYVGSNDHNLYALKASTGAKLWRFATGEPVYSSPAVVNGVVYFGSGDNNVYALNASTGALLWRFETLYGVSSPAVASGVVYFGSGDLNVYALKASTGAKLWSFATGGGVGSSPAVGNGVVYIGSMDHKVYALKASTGAKLWSYTISTYAHGNIVTSALALANGVVYVTDRAQPGYFYSGTLLALNAITGARLSYFPSGISPSSPTIVDGVIYFRSESNLGSNVQAFTAP